MLPVPFGFLFQLILWFQKNYFKFSQNWYHWANSVKESPCPSVCLLVCTIRCSFLGLSLALRSHNQFPCPHWSPSLPPSPLETWKLRNSETQKFGNSETWLLGNSETWTPRHHNFFFVCMFWYQFYFSHRSRDSVSSICGILIFSLYIFYL